MKICLIGGAGFIGTNLAIHLSQTDEVTVIDRDEKFFTTLKSLNLPINYKVASFDINSGEKMPDDTLLRVEDYLDG